jgi:hypothetical protein
MNWPAEGKLALALAKGTAVLESVPAGSAVFIDGTEAGRTPLMTELTPGRHAVEFRRRNATRTLNIAVVTGRSVVGRLDWSAKRPGSLEILSDPDGAEVTVDGVARGVTPLTIDDLSAGSHVVGLTGRSGSLQRTVEVGPDRVAQIAESIRSGWVHVSAPIDLDIVDGTRPVQLDERNQVLLRSGVHDLRFENTQLGYRDRRKVDVKAGAITSISIVPPGSPLTVSATLPSDVLVDGERVGNTPLTDHYVDLGPRLVTVRSITGAERRFTITATVNPSRLAVDFSKP